MNDWFLSDPHFGHKLVCDIRFRRTHPGVVVPQDVVDWHDETLQRNWRGLIHPRDRVWLLGDISSGSPAPEKRALEILSDLPGEKHLITGNHDGPHPMHRDSFKVQRRFLEVFASVQMAAKRRFPGRHDGHVTVFLSHFPYKADRGLEARHLEWRLRNEGVILLHGHTHWTEKLSYDDSVEGNPTPQIHVGLDAWGMRPVSFEQVKQLVWQVSGDNENQGPESLASPKSGDSPE